jgi:hypothetical protein
MCVHVGWASKFGARVRKQALLFLQKKKQKKLLFVGGCGSSVANAPRSRRFLFLFFKKEVLAFLSARFSLG